METFLWREALRKEALRAASDFLPRDIICSGPIEKLLIMFVYM